MSKTIEIGLMLLLWSLLGMIMGQVLWLIVVPFTSLAFQLIGYDLRPLFHEWEGLIMITILVVSYSSMGILCLRLFKPLESSKPNKK